MVWGCFSFYGMGNIVIIDQTLKAINYLELLANNLEFSATKMGLSSYIFQQDGAPCHTAKIINAYFVEKEINVLKWAAQSLDLNPIEYIWAWIKRKMGDMISVQRMS